TNVGRTLTTAQKGFLAFYFKESRFLGNVHLRFLFLLLLVLHTDLDAGISYNRTPFPNDTNGVYPFDAFVRHGCIKRYGWVVCGPTYKQRQGIILDTDLVFGRRTPWRSAHLPSQGIAGRWDRTTRSHAFNLLVRCGQLKPLGVITARCSGFNGRTRNGISQYGFAAWWSDRAPNHGLESGNTKEFRSRYRHRQYQPSNCLCSIV